MLDRPDGAPVSASVEKLTARAAVHGDQFDAGGFRALGEPTRLSLALALRDGHELCVCDLSWIVERPQNLVSHHMKALKAQGVVRSRRDGKMTMYALTGKGRALLAALEAGAE